ncbi:MAG: hypothetical protein RR686_18275 [Morganella sp. (in: enterobacteria)]
MKNKLAWIATAISIFFTITCAIFFYWDINTDNKWSTFFSFLSSLSIIATVVIFLVEKKKDELKFSIKKNGVINSAMNELNSISDKINKNRDSLIGIMNYYYSGSGSELVETFSCNDSFVFRCSSIAHTVEIINTNKLLQSINEFFNLDMEIYRILVESESIVRLLNTSVTERCLAPHRQSISGLKLTYNDCISSYEKNRIKFIKISREKINEKIKFSQGKETKNK